MSHAGGVTVCKKPTSADLLLWCHESRGALMAGPLSASNPGAMDIQEKYLAHAFQHARDAITDIYICDMLCGLGPLTKGDTRTRVLSALQALAYAVAMLQYYTPRESSLYSIRAWVSKELRRAEELVYGGRLCYGIGVAKKVLAMAPACESHLAGVADLLRHAQKHVAKQQQKKK